MDDGMGRFRQFNGSEEEYTKLTKQYPNHGAVFSEGEILEIKGSRFRASKIIQGGLKLALLPKDQQR